MSRRRVYAELEPDEYGNRPDIRFLPHLFKHKETPWKAIGLAVALLCIGTLFLTLGVLALQGNLHVEDKGTPRELVRARPEAQNASRRADEALAARAAAHRAKWRSPVATQAFALTVLGSITFVPGFFYTRLAFYAYKGYAGYSFDDIPDVD